MTAIWLGCLAEDAQSEGGVWLGRTSQLGPRAQARYTLPPGTWGAMMQMRRLVWHWILEDERRLDTTEVGLGVPAVAEAESLGLLVRIWPLPLGPLSYPPEKMYRETYEAIYRASQRSPEPPIVLGR